MLIKVPKSWQIPERDATPETDFLTRRKLLALAALPMALPAATRNPEFTLDRPLTEEWAVTSYNNYYEFSSNKQKVKDLVGNFKLRPWTVEISGLCDKPQKLSIEEIEKTMPIEERLYRHRCVEAWSMAVPWTGFVLSNLLKRAEPKSSAKFVRFTSVNRPGEMPGIGQAPSFPWPYVEGLRMDEAMHPLTFAVTGLYGKPLPIQNGAPLRLAIPWKYGFKGGKAIFKIEFIANQPATTWNTAGPKEYGFYANVNPKAPHPRWSQAVEQIIPTMGRRPTLLYNGYEKWVASMYNGQEI
ncbi:protein-methionine-sulfoxide reductase catalytic subunit MsrP [Bryobacter aggregatus]|uniref:protein-methionine-sulfoxide reductase catalytic subunit MsrP n=1 Tax=Bryobacter aggregatus TaxID=360054 RepID=UPI0004E128DE|nr:protein-methionine-sulfoxide reductase catalytic subunit MsrP [Bryobacter aggregatus]